MSERPKFKAWITKYALSSGIECIDAEHCNNISEAMISDTSSQLRHFHGEGKDWHRTEEAAKARAEQMRIERIASLRKQIAKLEKMLF